MTFNPPLNTLFYFQTPLAARCLPPLAECPLSVSFTFSFIASGSGVTLCLGCLHRVMLKLFKFFHVKYFANNTKSKVYMQCNHFTANCFSNSRDYTHTISLQEPPGRAPHPHQPSRPPSRCRPQTQRILSRLCSSSPRLPTAGPSVLCQAPGQRPKEPRVKLRSTP